tara:strand:- start:1232 stop:1468 length:237 start_codon:yes stop_codon:yes gene_type:complete
LNKDTRDSLSDNDMLFTLLTAIVKKSGGEIEISANEMDSVTTKDMLMMYYDQTDDKIILRTHFASGKIISPGLDHEVM